MRKPFERPQTVALAAQSEIRDLIARGILLPGDKINEVSLSKMLAVSRGSIREALRALENENIVSYEAQKGASVRKLSSDDARELYDIRRGLAMVAAPQIAANCTAEAIEGLERLFRIMDRYVDEDNLPRFHETNREFHMLLFLQAGNQRLLDLYISLFDEVYLLRSLNFLSQGSTRRSQEGHKQIIDSLKTGDEKIVSEKITSHLTTSRNFVVSIFEEKDGKQKRFG